MFLLLIIATILVLASEESRGYGLLLFALLVYLHPNIFAGTLLILGLLWLLSN